MLGRQLPGQREQGVSEVVAMGTWMLTKAREAVSSHSALLRSLGLLSQASSPSDRTQKTGWVSGP